MVNEVRTSFAVVPGRATRNSASLAVALAVAIFGLTEHGSARSGASSVAHAGVPCESATAPALVRSFVRSLNEGDLSQLDNLFAELGQFRWYSTDGLGVRLSPVAERRSSLRSYFKRRHRAGEHLVVRHVRSNGFSAGYLHFRFAIMRSDATHDARLYRGKGAALCDKSSAKIAIWSMARHDQK